MKHTRGIRNLPQNASYAQLNSPVGMLTLVTSTQGLHAILWEVDLEQAACKKIIDALTRDDHEATARNTKKQLSEYFQAERKVFNLPLVMSSGTAFQQAAWKQLLNIPYGKTISYAEQAANLGDKNKARAVGLANGVNPISIIIPCHRVIGANGSLTGFGGGLDSKAYLLELEQKQ